MSSTPSSSSFSKHVHSTRIINHGAQAHIKQTNKLTKNKAPVKRKALKEHTKG
jgi:DNA-binding transcriptional MocR family regulator